MEKKDLTVITLDTGKRIGFRELKIRDMNMAAKAAARESSDNQFVFQMSLQQELLKNLMVSIDGKTLSGNEKENLDEILSPSEYMAANEFMGQLVGKAKVTATEMQKHSGAQ
jgi:hypothetical protein